MIVDSLKCETWFLHKLAKAHCFTFKNANQGFASPIHNTLNILIYLNLISLIYFEENYKAKIGYWVKLDVKSTRNVFLKIVSGNNRVIFNVSSMSFEQTVNIDYNENYTIGGF